MPHAFGIVIHCDAKIGKYCNLSQDVTIGVGGRGEKQSSPKLGDRFYVGAGTRIIGPITIGNDVASGANTVVTKDVPDNAVGVGIHAKIISYNCSKELTYLSKKNTF